MLKQYQDLYRDMEECALLCQPFAWVSCSANISVRRHCRLHERVKRKKGSPEFAVAEELCRQFKSVAGNKLPTCATSCWGKTRFFNLKQCRTPSLDVCPVTPLLRTYNQEIHHKYYGSVKQVTLAEAAAQTTLLTYRVCFSPLRSS